MLSAWWLTEVPDVIHADPDQTNPRSSRLDFATTETLLKKISPHLLIRPYKCCLLWWTRAVREESRETLKRFLNSDATKHAMGLTDERVDSIIVNYEKQKREKK